MKPSIWQMKLDSVQPAVCDLCGGERSWGAGKGRFKFCDGHNTWKTYFSIPKKERTQIMRTGVWANIERLVKSPKCAVCDKETNLGGKGRFDLCKEHNNWRTYIKLRWGK